MTKKQENKRSMYSAVMAALETNTDAVGAVPALANAKTEFGGLIKQIDDKNIEKREASAGKMVSKDQAEEDLITSVVKVSAALVAFANRSKNADLKERAEATPSRLRQLRDTELVSRATAIQAAANEVMGSLSDYGIKAETLTDLNSKITVFDAAIKSRQSSVAERSAAGIDLADLFDNADALLKNELDKLVELVKDSHKQFYNIYQSARVIKDLGHGKREKSQPEATT
jgi:hypothetical protein